MEYLAHSEKDGIKEQSYYEHVKNVNDRAIRNAEEAAIYSKKDGDLLIDSTAKSALWHDLGKLMKKNQDALHDKTKYAHLPINHVDAGAAALQINAESITNAAALAIYSHHRGLPNIPLEISEGKPYFRDKGIRNLVDGELQSLIDLHCSIMKVGAPVGRNDSASGNRGVFYRMQMSCLADADHTDTAVHYGNYPADQKAPPLRAKERLARLDEYVGRFKKDSDRNLLRAEMYDKCRNSEVTESVSACDSPVGSGKTYAVMAHLLAKAIQRDARRIFVVLPFTNIITQSVEKYRESLVLPGERPEDVVAELHHRADFESLEARAFSAQWKAPIIVTTAVAFFETIASNRPAALRRLHELPGSMIFIDEAHAALPIKLLPVAWRWIRILADEWSCYWVLASGSLVRFWEIEGIAESQRNVPQIVADDLRNRLSEYENRRINYKHIKNPLNRKELINHIKNAPGPRLVIMNTVLSAGVIANDISKLYGEEASLPLEKRRVLHLSTALCAADREATIDEVKRRLKNAETEKDWVLVATSCVEAGVDFSFRTGFREIASLLSLLQAAGRISRNGEYEDAAIWSFSMQDEPMLSSNPGLKDSSYVLNRFFDRNKEISPALCTLAIQKELERSDTESFAKALLKDEKDMNFIDVEKSFKVIESDTVLAIPDQSTKEKIKYGMCDWRDIQRKGVSIRKYWAQKARLPMITEGIYDWNLRYDNHLGIAAGLIDYQTAAKETLIC